MLVKSGLFVFLLTALQVSARYKAVIPNTIENEMNPESVSSSRIVAGWVAQPGAIPHHVALRTVNNAGTVFRCGGTIASKEWVITAAWCFKNSVQSLTVRLGLSFNNPDYIFDATEWYAHPSYDLQIITDGAQLNDIALVKLPHPIVYSNFVKPIRVQRSADAYRNYAGEQVSFSGHGWTSSFGAVSDELRWIYTQAISNTECAQTHGSYAASTVICTRSTTAQTPCDGDWGGALVHIGSDGVPTVIGIYSFRQGGTDPCNSGGVFGFTRPGPYLAWFKEVTGLDFENLQEDTTTTTTTTPTTTTIPPDDSGSGEGDDSESGQLLKRLQVSVKVKVRMDKFNTTKA